MNAIAHSETEGVDFQRFAHEKVMEWSRLCRQFLDVQRREIFQGNPTPAQQEAHRNALKWMLRMTRALHATVADPDYPDPSLAPEMSGRLIQLEHSWRMANNPMSDAEADQLLARVFPNER
jgi:hypothetical protein